MVVDTGFLTRHKWFWDLMNNWPWAANLINRALINGAVGSAPTRPHPFSTLSSYSSWDSLTDRTWNGRHLPAKQWGPQPDLNAVAELFRRPAGRTRYSPRSTVLFPSFAQWFTDAFLRTDPTNPLRNTSPHEICLSQLYGQKSAETCAIRQGWGGRLKSQLIGGEEYPPYLFEDDGVTHKPEFRDLPPPFRLTDLLPDPALVPPDKRPALIAQRCTMFAFAGDRANSTALTSMIGTLFLREHNRICGVLLNKHPHWDDERVFQIARNIAIVLLIKIVVEDYINHISPYHFLFRADPSVCWDANWNRQNWIAAEFNLLYRWHSLVPDLTTWPGRGVVRTWETMFDNRFLTDVGLGPAVNACSTQNAGMISLLNTPDFLMHTITASIRAGRAAGLPSYNDYRVMLGRERATQFDQVTSDPIVQDALKGVYGTPENIEFYVGLSAEAPSEEQVNQSPGPFPAVTALIGTMVGIDAFSQALTNPLLSQHVFNAETFSREGMEIIEQTRFLEDLLVRNVPAGSGPFRANMNQPKPPTPPDPSPELQAMPPRQP